MKTILTTLLLLTAACAESPYKNRDVTYRAVRTHQQVLLMCQHDPKNCGYSVPYYMK